MKAPKEDGEMFETVIFYVISFSTVFVLVLLVYKFFIRMI